jgi:hypothetical protein
VKESLGVVLSYDPRFGTMDVAFIPEPLADQSAPSEMIYGVAFDALDLTCQWLNVWLQRIAGPMAGST